jgi:hypothetical protein
MQIGKLTVKNKINVKRGLWFTILSKINVLWD